MNKWHKRFIELAQIVGSWSKDPSTGVGAVVIKGKHVVGMGYNGYPKGVPDTLDDPREIKYGRTIHAEMNAILDAKRDLTGCTLYVTPLLPCERCATVIVQSGIKKVIAVVQGGDKAQQARWKESNTAAMYLFDKAGVKVKIKYI